MNFYTATGTIVAGAVVITAEHPGGLWTTGSGTIGAVNTLTGVVTPSANCQNEVDLAAITGANLVVPTSDPAWATLFNSVAALYPSGF